MLEEQDMQKRLDEQNRCKDLVWDQNRDEFDSDMVSGEKNEAAYNRFEELIHVGQNVFLTGGQLIGRITKLLPDAEGRVSYVVLRTARFPARHKLLPVALVTDITPEGVWLSIQKSKFQELHRYKTDRSIADEIARAMWNDQVLRRSDNQSIDIQVENGVISLTGHITSRGNQERVDKAVAQVSGIRGMRTHLVASDKLLLKVAGALIPIGRVEGNHVFARVDNGVVSLSGKVINKDFRNFAEQYAAYVPWVRGVINRIAAPGVDLDTEDHRFLQPVIGEMIFFRDGLFGVVTQVVVNQNNRRVIAIIIKGRFPEKKQNYESMTSDEKQTPEHLAVIPVSAIRYITSISGFLLIDSNDTTGYQDFDPANFVAPNAGWVPPYPYCADNILFLT